MYQAFPSIDAGISDRDLRIEIFTVCESASDNHGRLSLAGTFENVQTPQFPLILPQLLVVVRVRFWPMEGLLHTVRLTVTDPDGRQIMTPVESPASLQPRSDEQSAAYNIMFPLRDVCIEGPGEHAIDFYLNDVLQGRLPLNVLPAPTPADDVREWSHQH